MKVSVPIDQIPVFVRAGSIVPLGAEIQSTAAKQSITEIRVYSGKDGDFALYDDDGTSYDYEQCKGTTTMHLNWSDAAGTLGVTGGNKTMAGAVKGLVKVIGR
ncbi:DUF5110 domain-containing protein [Dyella choica]|uniref:DUF5110 domain-containing protein n=1 Tax=Dyella choica TaxID=1927959 RepID=UPI001E2AEE30|nr:DUF5110 domain-containing protein [Dyella choica]